MSQLDLKFIGAAMFAAVMAATPVQAFAVQLITEEEAKLPPLKGAVPNSGRGVTRGPKIQLPEVVTVSRASPIHFQVKFQTYGGSHVDLDSLKVTYLKSPVVDLTPRIKPFLQQLTGIDIPDAQLPPGEHLLRIDVKDTDGRAASNSFVLKIAP
jgi:hypothetical protein